MGLLNKILKATEAAYDELTADENYTKGVDFEKYVISLFNEEYFRLHDWTRDNSGKIDRKVESDSNPDLTIRYIKTNELFSIECKFRSELYNNAVEWARPDQIINYLNHSLRNKIPTFVVIGLRGSPDKPKRMFCIPIEEARYPKLFISFLEKYERDPHKSFFWKNKNLQ
jgi:hypothetical protein